jgi:GT2 family glycosyltransferase
VIVVNWDRKDDLKGCLESVLNQTFKDIELIVVDNHSTDGSIEMLRDEYPAVKLIVLPDNSYGACEAFNIGFANAVGEFCLVMDNDALLEDSWVLCALREFKTDSQLGCLSGRVLNYYTKHDWGFENYGLSDAWQEKSFFMSTFAGCAAVIKKEVIDKVGGYPTEYFLYWNELALGAAIINAGYKIKYVPTLTAYHKVAEAQRPGARHYYYMTRNGYWYFWTYYPFNLAVRHTLAHFYVSLRDLVENPRLLLEDPLLFLKASADTLKGLVTVVKKREPIVDRDVLRPIKW